MGVEWTELAFYGGSFTCLPNEIRLKLYSLAQETGIKRLRFSTSPDCINEKVLSEALSFGVKTVEIGVQSLDDFILKVNRRPYLSAECEKAVVLAKGKIETVGIQLMTGLYKEDFSSFSETVERSVELKADYARIYPTVVIEDTKLADLYRIGSYQPLTLAEAVSRSAYAYIFLTASGTNVIRVGLHDSQSVRDSAMAGAYHPAMGDMVKTVVVRTFLRLGGKISVDQKYLNVVYGYGGILKDMCSESVDIKTGAKPDFKGYCRYILEELGEDNKRKLKEQTDSFAERFVSQTDNR